jgi:hypothetical protein
MKKLKFFTIVAVTVVVSLSALPIKAQAAITGQNFLLESFNQLRLKPAVNGEWWVINNGDENGYPQRWEANCGDASCTTAERERGVSLARLKLTPDATPGFYTGTEISEYETGFAYGVPGKWVPTYGHPVIVSVRLKWSSNFNADGSGGAIGTSGFWLWNSPIDIPNQAINPQDGIGFNWIEQGSAMLPGLQASVLNYSYPVYSAVPTNPVNMQNWNLFTFIWSVDQNGVQSVTHLINTENLGTYNLDMPLGPMSLTIWHDNQFPTWEGIEVHNPTSNQSMDVDLVTIARL